MHALDALGSPVRRKILKQLRTRSMSVAEIAGHFPISRPAISRHLRLLEDAGLVQPKQEGTRNVYAVRVEGFASARAYLDEFWDTALARLQELARK